MMELVAGSGPDADGSFPDAAELAAAIGGVEIAPNLTVADAAARLHATSARLDAYEDIEDLAIKSLNSAEARELAGEMLPIRNAIADELWARELLVGVEIVDHLLFCALKSRGSSAVRTVVEALRRARVGDSGLLVFAVHSLGLTADNLRSLTDGAGVEVIDPDWGVAITPQTNRLDATMDFLERVRVAFGVQGSLRSESIEHWRRSRQTRWLECNPLLVVRVAEAAGTYYGNEALLLARLQAATVLVSMLAALQPTSDRTGRATLSTYVLNNQQTLDIHHYLVLSPGRAPGADLDGDCVPISRGRPDVVAMSELRLDLDPAYWAGNRSEGDRVAHAVAALYRAYLRAGFDPARTDDESRRNRRWFDAMIYFQRSFSGQAWRDTITLATAFELLLHPPSKGDTSKVIRKAIKRFSGGSSEGDRHAEAFGRIYRARNEIVHGGARVTTFDIDQTRRAFVAAFLGHMEEQGLL